MKKTVSIQKSKSINAVEGWKMRSHSQVWAKEIPNVLEHRLRLNYRIKNTDINKLKQFYAKIEIK